MKVEQIYTKCLAQGSYYIESNGEAVVIDPLRDIDEYIKLAETNNSKIKYVLETHFHADFISGHLTLSNLTGAEIIYGPNADPEFEAIIAEDNQIFNFGNASLTTIKLSSFNFISDFSIHLGAIAFVDKIDFSTFKKDPSDIINLSFFT